MTGSTIHVVIVDDCAFTRYALRTLVATTADIEIAAVCAGDVNAEQVIGDVLPDVVVLADLELAKRLRQRYDKLGIVVLMTDEDDVLFRALETGVSAFVSKAAPVDEVLSAIRHAAVAALSFTSAGLGAALSRRRAQHATAGISPREREVLKLLRDGLTVPSIARRLVVSESTAKTYVTRLYGKLGTNNRSSALMTALRIGLIRSS